MTTQAAARLYLVQHLYEHKGKEPVVYNPFGKKLEDLPVIYGFNNGGSRELLSAVLIAEDGTGLGGHCCSDEAYMLHDLGILEGTRTDRHKEFRKHYPDGYRMEFVKHEDFKTNEGLKEACRKEELKRKSV